MIYGGDLMSNFAGSMQHGDSEMTKAVVISKIAKLIENDPKSLIKALNDSGVSIDDKTSVVKLIDKSIEALYDNQKFRTEISKLLISGSPKFSNAVGEETDAISKIGGGIASGGVVGAVSGAVDSIFGTIGKFKDAKNQKESDKRALQMQLLQSDDKKTNWLPIVIISGVLVIGGIVAYISLKKK